MVEGPGTERMEYSVFSLTEILIVFKRSVLLKGAWNGWAMALLLNKT